METWVIITVVVIVVLIIVSGFFSGSETALTATARSRMHWLEGEGDRRARIVNSLLDDKENLIGAILFGNNLVNILASALATNLFVAYMGSAGVAYATILMTAVVLIFAEVLPKTYAITHTDQMALTVSRPIRALVFIFAPIVRMVQFVVRSTLRMFGVSVGADSKVLSAHDELRGAIDLHHKEGAVVKIDRDMLGGILDLPDIEVGETMVHRKNMVMVDGSLPPHEIVDQILGSPHTRVPIWKEEHEDIIGVLHVKDLLRAMNRNQGRSEGLDVVSLATPPWFVPETTTLKEQLDAFLKRRNHFALVVDEYGALMGLITLEDILEEIVGDISDEHDIARRGIRPQDDGSVLVQGTIPIRDLNRAMDWHLPDEEATTIAGLVIHEAQTIPDVGQAFTYHGFKFEIAQRKRNQITALRIRPLDLVAEEAVQRTSEQPHPA